MHHLPWSMHSASHRTKHFYTVAGLHRLRIIQRMGVMGQRGIGQNSWFLVPLSMHFQHIPHLPIITESSGLRFLIVEMKSFVDFTLGPRERQDPYTDEENSQGPFRVGRASQKPWSPLQSVLRNSNHPLSPSLASSLCHNRQLNSQTNDKSFKIHDWAKESAILFSPSLVREQRRPGTLGAAATFISIPCPLLWPCLAPHADSQMRVLATQQDCPPVHPTPHCPTHSTKHLLLALPHLRASNLIQFKPKHPTV